MQPEEEFKPFKLLSSLHCTRLLSAIPIATYNILKCIGRRKILLDL